MSKIRDVHTGNTSQELIIEGASCASCVGKIETALKNIEGVENAEMNFALSTVLVTGQVEAEHLIKTIEGAGYQAKSTNLSSDEQLLIARETVDQEYYSRLIRQVWIALGLGVPLMIYSLVGGPMTVDTTLERGIWLVSACYARPLCILPVNIFI